MIMINCTIDEFLNKWKKEKHYDVSVGYFSVEGDFTLNFKSLHVDKNNIEEFEELLNDYNINRKIWEKTEKCKQCHHHNSQIENDDDDE
ncbi:hypothetical protein [Spiroplasma endosymbiont of Colias croceus]|uniref:hypothetical protein n=1 Tax=Spiroplasma endosymbiont of Colias croceus TaxID=3066310 RepID=UPI0030D25A61